MNNFLSACLVATVFGGMLYVVFLLDSQDQIYEQELYCEMVAIGKETNLEYGWPDYKGTYEKYCK